MSDKKLPERLAMTVPEAASFLGVSTGTIYRFFSTGDLTKHVKWQRTLADVREVERLAKEREKERAK